MFFIILKSETIISTSYDASTDTEIYKVTINNYFSNNNILCSTTICHIICDIATRCHNLLIDASQSNQLILECRVDNSCENLIISQAPHISANILWYIH